MKETPAQANNAYTATKLFFNWCVSQHLIAVSPLHGIKTPFKKATRERLLSDDEIRVVWRASYHDSVLGQVIRSLILSGQRLNQIASFDPTWVHDDRITFPASVMKTDVPHTMPLTAELAKHLPSSPSRANNLSAEMIKFRKALALAHAAFDHPRSSCCRALHPPRFPPLLLIDHGAVAGADRRDRGSAFPSVGYAQPDPAHL